MNLATVVIVGRPNVGKSSFFNRVLGRRAAVVANREGVTRDRHYQIAEWCGVYFQIVDTGGFMAKDTDVMDGLVRRQIQVAVEEADLVLFLVDGRTGIAEMDQAFARVIQKSNKPVILAVNKAEARAVALEASQFWSLGLGEPFPVSALQGDGIADMLDAVVAQLPSKPKYIPKETKIRVAILGRPNAGKSTMVNSLVGEERVITDDRAGTTRDAIDTEFEYNGTKFVLTDTAGLRRKARVTDEVEYFSNMRALEAIRRSDVCLLLVDAKRKMEIQDFRICTLIQETGKGLIIALNKWDTVEPDSKTFDHMVKELQEKNPDLEGFPFLSTSGLTGKRLIRVLDEIIKVKANLSQVLGRENVIRFFEETLAKHPHPSTSAGPVILTRSCQVMVNPPALAFEVAHPERIIVSYVRYLKRQAIDFFNLSGAPLRIWFRSRFKLRTDEELLSYLHWGAIPPEVKREWLKEEIGSQSSEAFSDADGSEMMDDADVADDDNAAEDSGVSMDRIIKNNDVAQPMPVLDLSDEDEDKPDWETEAEAAAAPAVMTKKRAPAAAKPMVEPQSSIEEKREAKKPIVKKAPIRNTPSGNSALKKPAIKKPAAGKSVGRKSVHGKPAKKSNAGRSARKNPGPKSPKGRATRPSKPKSGRPSTGRKGFGRK